MTPTEKTPARPFWVLLLQRDSEDVLYEATAMTAAAVSLGIDVTLIWFDAALEALVSGRLSEGEADAGNAGRLLREAREAGSVRLLACSASIVNRRVDRDRISRCVDGIVGWPTAISLIRSAERSFIW
jgi:predicted peroxiredoxin